MSTTQAEQTQTNELEDNIIFSYSWDDAVNDGTFVDVSKVAKEAGIKFPTAVTSNLYHTYLKPNEEMEKQGQSLEGRLWDVLTVFRFAIRASKNTNHLEFKVDFLMPHSPNPKAETVKIWATCEARSPQNPEPIITLMLPEDY